MALHGCQSAVAREAAMADFSWGETVRVKVGAHPARRPGAVAEVIGIREVETEAQARQFEARYGSKLYLIEFGDGTSVEIPEDWIEPASGS
jgi:hypothetical protein